MTSLDLLKLGIGIDKTVITISLVSSLRIQHKLMYFEIFRATSSTNSKKLSTDANDAALVIELVVEGCGLMPGLHPDLVAVSNTSNSMGGSYAVYAGEDTELRGVGGTHSSEKIPTSVPQSTTYQ